MIRVFKINQLVSIFLIASFAACIDLEPTPSSEINVDDLWKYPDAVQGLIGECYDLMSRSYDNNEGAFLDCATDNAVKTSMTDPVVLFSKGVLASDPFKTYWERDYKAIRLVNMFLEDRKGFNTRFLINERWDSITRNRLHGEAFGLRAWFQWDLLQKFGGKSTNGDYLGFPIITRVMSANDNIVVTRNTYEECVKQIIADCDSAFAYLPLANRDYLYPEGDRAYAGSKYFGRIDGVTVKALKALVYLRWASPRFNPNNDISRWDSAAINAKYVMDFKMSSKYDGRTFFPTNRVNWQDPNDPSIIFRSRFDVSSQSMEKAFYPKGFLGNGVMGATQNLVDAFGMKDGFPIDYKGNSNKHTSKYDPTNPYLNRDPRFYSIIFYHGSTANRDNLSTNVMYTFDCANGTGQDVANLNTNNSRTNYYIKKFLYMGLNFSDKSVLKQPRCNFFIRWSHICLAFAEAANHVVGPLDESKYGMSAKQALAYIRSCKTYDGANGISTADPYLNEVALLGKSEFNELVKNERRIETCFEGSRFFDLNRWTTTTDELNGDVYGMEIKKGLYGQIELNPRMLIEKRNFKTSYIPIPYSEILISNNQLLQNEGAEYWTY
ncbi:hypothetical protein SDC9_47797 [bioreactor metagenome]|uniref:RagB/SusD family nutrient uptake outer membrane protein n=1 Tax=bioreactor metagenome TaxID=1076179 RepID=A0A644WDF8_9ZZZZ|nr:RagB/SusD family nutrient uptake outer membrane protein [Paludibacter sp.]